MGLFNKIRNEFIDIIEWPNQEEDVLVYRFPRYNNEIKMGAKLIVRPGQHAVFVNEGEIADHFEPGTYTLETKNLPVLTTLKSWPYAFNSPFKAEVYFIRKTEMLDRKWGTGTPIIMRDADFGMVRLRARGNFSYQVAINNEMISRFVGSQDIFYSDDLEGQIKTKLISSFSDCIGELKIPALDLVANYDEISEAMYNKLFTEFNNVGLELKSFAVENISLPEEVHQAMDQRASMGAIGNLNNFSQYQAANAMRDAAQNQGDTGAMMGMMMGAQFGGGALGNTLIQDQNKNQPNNQTPPPIPQQKVYFAVINDAQAGPYDLNTLKIMVQQGNINSSTLLWTEGMSNWETADSIADINIIFNSTPPPIPGN